jgi:hypothetical protein
LKLTAANLLTGDRWGADHAGQGNNFASKCVEAAAVYRIAPYEEREKFCLLLLLQQKLSV